MDPNKVLQEIIDMAVDGDAEGLAEVSTTLVVWLRGGGFPPKDPRKIAHDEGYREGYTKAQEPDDSDVWYDRWT